MTAAGQEFLRALARRAAALRLRPQRQNSHSAGLVRAFFKSIINCWVRIKQKLSLSFQTILLQNELRSPSRYQTCLGVMWQTRGKGC
jgi:hypothetical protein